MRNSEVNREKRKQTSESEAFDGAVAVSWAEVGRRNDDFSEPDGDMRGVQAAYECLQPEGRLIPHGYRLRGYLDSDMRIDDDRPTLTKLQKQWRRQYLDTTFQLRLIPQHRHPSWKSPLYRRVNDIDKYTINR